MSAHIAVVIAAVGSASATTAIDAAWFDGAGRLVMLPATLFPSKPLVPATHTSNDAIALFDEVCLKRSITNDAPASATASRPWGFAKFDTDAGVASGNHIVGWQAQDISVASLPAVWPLAECTVSYASPSTLDADTVARALSTSLGSTPEKRSPTRLAAKVHVTGLTMQWGAIGRLTQSQRIYMATADDGSGRHRLYLGVTEAKSK